jgi:hypothetical protein
VNFFFFDTQKETGYCKSGNEKFGFHKMQGIPRPNEKLLVSQKGTCSVELDLLRYYAEVKLSVLDEVHEVPNNDEVTGVDLCFQLFLTYAFEKLHALVSDGHKMQFTRITRFVAVRNCRYVYYRKL